MKKKVIQRYNNPWKVSFKDYIAVAFMGFFFYVGRRSLIEEAQAARIVLDSIIPLIAVILAGYFAQEGYTQYQKWNSGDKTDGPI